MRHLAVPALLLFLAAPAFADPPADPPAPAQPAAAAPPAQTAAAAPPVSDADLIVCKWMTLVGSRFPERVCLTKSRWDLMHKKAADFIRDIQQRSEGGQTP